MDCDDEELAKTKELRKKLQKLKDLEWELSDEQGYWGSTALLDEIEELEEKLGE